MYTSLQRTILSFVPWMDHLELMQWPYHTIEATQCLQSDVTSVPSHCGYSSE